MCQEAESDQEIVKRDQEGGCLEEEDRDNKK